MAPSSVLPALQAILAPPKKARRVRPVYLGTLQPAAPRSAPSARPVSFPTPVPSQRARPVRWEKFPRFSRPRPVRSAQSERWPTCRSASPAPKANNGWTRGSVPHAQREVPLQPQAKNVTSAPPGCFPTTDARATPVPGRRFPTRRMRRHANSVYPTRMRCQTGRCVCPAQPRKSLSMPPSAKPARAAWCPTTPS